MDIRFSLIFPFRERLNYLMHLLTTIRTATSNLGGIEVLIAADNDDPVLTIDKMEDIEREYKDINLRFFYGDRSIHFTKDYINPLARIAKGRFIMTINDDSEFITPDWDEILYNRLDEACSKLGDDIIYAMISDGKNQGSFSCWPIQSREAVKATGKFFNEKFYCWGPDVAIASVYKRLSQATGKQRIIKVPEVVVDHNSGHTGRRSFDSNFEYFRAIHDGIPNEYTSQDEQEEVAELNNYLNSKQT